MTTNNIFKSKEHYQAFRKAWSDAVNSDDTDVTAAHFILYNILRGRSYDKGFTPVTRPTKLRNGFYINHGLYHAFQELKWRLKNESFLDVFGGTVDADMISKLELPECKPMYSNYGPYKQVAEYIIGRQGEADVHVSFEHVDNLYKMVTEGEAA